MKIISNQQAIEILSAADLALGGWGQVVSHNRLSASVLAPKEYRSIGHAAELAMDWLAPEAWLLCCFDFSNGSLEGESEIVTEAAGASELVAGDQPLLFDRDDIAASATGLKLFASTLLGLEWHCYLVAQGRHGVRCIGLLDGVVDFVYGDHNSAEKLVAQIANH